MPRPLVGIPTCLRLHGGLPFHIAGDKYIVAAAEGAGAQVMLIPARGDALDMEDLLDRLDGLLFTGSPSNVEPRHYGGPTAPEGTLQDHARDSTTLPLLRAAVARKLPIFAICRGMQELNVALGGTLYQSVHAIPGRLDHRASEQLALDEQYATKAHPIAFTPDGLLHRWTGETTAEVNSIHGQGIDTLSDVLAVEALAPDGQIEAVRHADADRFVFGTQWHPEWRYWENPLSKTLFEAFGEAMRRGR